MENKKNHRILIVDDIEDNIISLKFLLELLPDAYEISSVMNGSDAISFVEKTPPDVVLLDINLPDINGYEVCRRIRSDGHLFYIPIILLTAYSMDIASKIRGYDFGADDFITKPFIKEELFARIRSVLRLKDLHDSLKDERDILDLKVKKRTEELSLILDNMQEVIFTRNMTGKLKFINPAFKRITGFSSDAIKDDDSLFYVHGEDRERIRENLRKSYEGGSCTEEFRIMTAGGKEKWIEGAWRPMLDNFGSQVGIQGQESDITDRKIAEDRLKESLNEKEILLKEIHHRVKNNMQIICSLIDLQAMNISDAMTLELFNTCQNRIRSMALVHEKLYGSEDFARIDFGSYIADVLVYLHESYPMSRDRVNITCNVEKIFLGIDSAIPVALILNELISNSLKHAFPDGSRGDIKIDFSRDENKKYHLTISDNGIGMPGDYNSNNSDSLGLVLVKGLVDQLKGSFNYEKNGGTKYIISF